MSLGFSLIPLTGLDKTINAVMQIQKEESTGVEVHTRVVRNCYKFFYESSNR